MPRFIVLHHETPEGSGRATHFDLMLEHGGVLRTWAMDKLPTAGEAIVAERLPDHRLHYLDYEGPLSRDRGHVIRVDAGMYEVVEETAAAIIARYRGEKLQGTVSLIRDEKEPHRWRVSMSPG